MSDSCEMNRMLLWIGFGFGVERMESINELLFGCYPCKERGCIVEIEGYLVL